MFFDLREKFELDVQHTSSRRSEFCGAVDTASGKSEDKIFDRYGYRLIPILLFCLFHSHTWTIAEDQIPLSPDAYRYLEPCDLVVADEGGTLLVLEQGVERLRSFPLENRSTSPAAAGDRWHGVCVNLPPKPERMKLFPDGKRLAIIGGGVNGWLLVLHPKDLPRQNRSNILNATTQATCSPEKQAGSRRAFPIPVGHTPSDVAIYSDPEKGRDVAYVANRFDGTISVVDLSLQQETARWEAGREPIALEITPDGRKLVVGGHLPEDDSLDGGIAVRFRFFRTADGSSKTIRGWTGSINLRGLTLSPDGRYAFASALIGHFEHIPTNVDNGWMNENVLLAVDVERERFADTFYFDDYTFGAGNPWGVSTSDCGRFLVVSHAGSREISLMNLRKIVALLDAASRTGTSTGFSINDFTTPETGEKLPMRLRVPLGLTGMRRAVMNQNRVFVSACFEDAIGRLDLEFIPDRFNMDGHRPSGMLYELPERIEAPPIDGKNRGFVAESLLQFVPLAPLHWAEGLDFRRSFARLGPKPVPTVARQGEILFHDAIICYQRWQSCSSCHPDARSDTLNWDLLNDGMGNPKNTKSMLLSHETPPSMASGVRKDAETAVRSGLSGILFAEFTEEEAAAIDVYLQNLVPIPSPRLIEGRLSESAKRGKLLFGDSRTGCSVCHPEPFFTDLLRHDVGTRIAHDSIDRFDTPTLVEVWRTAPYLHDGRYKTLRELIVDGKHHAPDDRLEKLTDREIDDLIEYVLSL